MYLFLASDGPGVPVFGRCPFFFSSFFSAIPPLKTKQLEISIGERFRHNAFHRSARLRHTQALQAYAYLHAYLNVFRLRRAYLHVSSTRGYVGPWYLVKCECDE